MTIRKEKHIEDFIKEIHEKYNISVVERQYLEDVFYSLFNRDFEDHGKFLYLIQNEEWQNLLGKIPDSEIEYYAEIDLNMIKLVDVSLDDFGYDEIEKEACGRGIVIEKENNMDIILESQLEELTSNFLSADLNKRQNILNNSK